MRTVHRLRPRDHACATDGAAWVVGFDEVGVGCLAGPVVAAAFAYPLNETWLNLDPPCLVRDSKKMSEKQRAAAAEWLASLDGAIHKIVEVSSAEIDEINILRAAQAAMSRAFEHVQARLRERGASRPGTLLIDGNRLPVAFRALKAPWRAETIVKGDDKSFAIAAASILAKEYRDRLMGELAREHPGYGWESNVGYPTVNHKIAIRDHGPTPHHRRSFNWELNAGSVPADS